MEFFHNGGNILQITGIICEYNPLHLGHKKQLDWVRAQNPEGGIVCLMSGNFVQRGHPAVFDKLTRAKAAVQCGADLVLELPLNAALSSAEGFARGGVRILGSFCDRLCFGAETNDERTLVALAEALLCPVVDRVLMEALLGLAVVLVLWLEATLLALVLAALHQQTLRKAHRLLPEPVV